MWSSISNLLLVEDLNSLLASRRRDAIEALIDEVKENWFNAFATNLNPIWENSCLWTIWVRYQVHDGDHREEGEDKDQVGVAPPAIVPEDSIT